MGGRPLFGANKTVRGLAVMPLATCACALAFVALCGRAPWLGGAMPAYEAAHPAAWGLLCGLGYVVGELPNSFVKRQLGVGPGEAGPGLLGLVLWTVDQMDSMLGVWLFLTPVWIAPSAVVLFLAAITLVMHPAIALLMVLLKVKRRIG